MCCLDLEVFMASPLSVAMTLDWQLISHCRRTSITVNHRNPPLARRWTVAHQRSIKSSNSPHRLFQHSVFDPPSIWWPPTKSRIWKKAFKRWKTSPKTTPDLKFIVPIATMPTNKLTQQWNFKSMPTPCSSLFTVHIFISLRESYAICLRSQISPYLFGIGMHHLGCTCLKYTPN